MFAAPVSARRFLKVVSNPDLSGFHDRKQAFLDKINLRMRPGLLCLIIIMCNLGLSAQTVPDSIFRDWKPDGPGGIVCVVQKGQVLFRKASGLADVSKKIPNGPALKYDLASNAKQFTAMSIALLEEQGKISREDPLRKFYPNLKIKDDIRIRNLIDHTSGLRDASVLAVLSGKMNLKGEVRKKFNTKEYYIQCLMSETDLNYPVGQELAYNNFNYVLLGDIVEKVSGQKLSAFIDSAIFKPLGMSHSLLRDKRKMKIENESVGYLWKGGDHYKRSDAFGGIVGDHNLLSTVDDLVRWQLNFSDNKLGKKDPALITKVSTASKLNDSSSSYYGYGLFSSQYKGVNIVHHGGDDGRETSMLLRFPDNDLSVIVVSNSSSYNVTEKIAYRVADIFLKDSLVEPTVEKLEPTELTFIKLEPAQWQSKAGQYTRVNERGLAEMIQLTYSDGKLIETWGNQRPGAELSAVTNSHFIAKAINGRRISLKFSDDEQGFVYQFHNFDTLHFKKFVPVRVNLSDYRGRYQNESTSAKIKVKMKGERLIARKGIFRIPLVEFNKDQYYAADNDALFTFVRASNGSVKSLRVDASDFRNFWFQKE